MRKVLTQTSVPYLVTILMAVVGWATLRAVDAVESASVEYCVHREDGGAHISVENLTREKRFRDLRFATAFRAGVDGEINKADLEAIPPAFEGDSPGGEIGGERRSAEFVIPDLQPGARFEMAVSFTSDEEPDFRLMTARDSLELLPCSTFTYVVKHEVQFVVGLALVGLALVLIFLWASRPEDPEPLVFEDD